MAPTLENQQAVGTAWQRLGRLPVDGAQACRVNDYNCRVLFTILYPTK